MHLKKILSLLAAAAMAVTAFTGAISASAETKTGTCGDVKWSFDSSTGKLTISGQGKMATPQDVDTSSGNRPEKNDFSETYTYKEYKDNIIEVEIEDGVTSIGYCAFYNFPNLETVSIPPSITEFVSLGKGYYAYYNFSFAECTKLKNLTLADGMTALGASAFGDCTALESVRIPKTLTANADGPGGNNGWGHYTFENCTSLKNVTLPEGLTVISAEAFANTAIESIVIPSTISFWSIRPEGSNAQTHNDAFHQCKKLSSVTFKSGITSIYGYPFEGCTSLKKIFIPATVTDIHRAFASAHDVDNTGIEEIAFEDGSQITEFGTQAFYGCENLKVLEIPENLNSVKNSVYTGCTSIEEIYVYSKDVHAYEIPYKQSENTKVYCFKDSLVYSDLIKENITPYDISNVISSKLEELNTAVTEAEKYPEKDYTAESYGELKTLLDEAATKNNESHVIGLTYLTEDIYTAIKGLEKKPPEDNTSGKGSDSSNSQQQTPNKTTPQTPTTAKPQKSTRSAAQVKKDKSAAKKAMKQAKITKLTAKSKAKKKITVSWKKVKNAKGYQVQVSAKKNFKKVIYNKSLAKNKLTIKSSKIKSKKTYYVRVRAYATYKDANNATKKIYSKWVKKIRKVKVK